MGVRAVSVVVLIGPRRRKVVKTRRLAPGEIGKKGADGAVIAVGGKEIRRGGRRVDDAATSVETTT